MAKFTRSARERLDRDRIGKIGFDLDSRCVSRLRLRVSDSYARVPRRPSFREQRSEDQGRLMNVSKPPFDLVPRLVLPAVLSIAACSRVGAAGEAMPAEVDAGVDAVANEPDLVDARADARTSLQQTLPGCSDPSPGLSTCGVNGGENCCASPLIEGGSFLVRQDGTGASPPPVTGQVSNFRLDRFEVTGGRFRRFVAAVEAGWSPSAGSGKHSHLFGNRGLALKAPNTFEAGWLLDWTMNLATTHDAWTANLSCPFATWTDTAGDRESFPINCVTWYEAYAFCIWDGGFLPSTIERSFAGAGGNEQRRFPWSSPPSSASIDCAHANYGGGNFPQTACVGAGQLGVRHSASVGSRSPTGDGRWGQADLTGNVTEWVLDRNGDPPDPCVDCFIETPTVNASPISNVSYGGDFTNSAEAQFGSFDRAQSPESRASWIGFRCARQP